MKLRNRKPERLTVDDAIHDVLTEMTGFRADSNDYDELLSPLERLTKMKARLAKADPKQGVNPDTLAVVAGNLLVACIVVGYEQHGLITTKLPSFLLKAK